MTAARSTSRPRTPILPVGSLVYHGTDTRFRKLRKFSFVSPDFFTAEYYAWPYLHTFEVIAQPRLVKFNIRTTIDDVCESGYDGFHVGNEIVMLCSPMKWLRYVCTQRVGSR